MHDVEPGHLLEDLAGEMVRPADAGRGIEHLPGFARASAMYSCNVLAGTDGCTTRITVLRVSSEIGAKSLSGS